MVQRVAYRFIRSRLIKPATGNAISPVTFPSCTTTKPPLMSERRFAAIAMSSFIVRTHDADIVAVVADRGGDCALLQAKALDEAIGMVAVLAVAFDDGDLQDVALEIDGRLVAVNG